ncbi:MAG TPA: hypothetical protein VLZ11_03620, partial [Flavobacterium sp.]|nr:hypothetical protein [Flavobacterium sp.]
MKLLSLKHFLLLLLTFVNSVCVLAQCPDVLTYNQTFCDLESATVANLDALDNGGGVAWYASLNSTTALPADTYLVNGNKYYADDSSGTCGNRQEVLVTIYTTPSAPSFQGICVNETSEATIALLLASGNNVQWYLTPSGGMPLASTTQLINNTLYYVSQTNPHTGCETSRRSVFVNIIILTTPVGDSNQSFCYNPQQGTPTLADIEIDSPLYNWYINPNSVIHLPLSTPLVDGHTYYATSVSGPCESQGRLAVTVHLFGPNDAGVSNTVNVCESDLTVSPTLNLFDQLGGTPQPTGSWVGDVIPTNAYLGTLDLTQLTPNIPYTFVYTVDYYSICPIKETTVSITIVPIRDAGTSASIALCEGDTNTYDLLDVLGGAPDSGGFWNPSLSGGNSIFNPAIDAFGTYIYSFNDGCNTSLATVTITELPLFDAGLDGVLNICEGDVQTYDLFDSLNGTPDLGGSWTPALAGGGSIFDPILDTSGIYTYSFNDSCSTAAIVTVAEIPVLNAGLDGSLDLCQGDTQTYDLFDSLNGTPDLGGSWTPALAGGGSIFDPTLDAFGAYIYSFNDTCNNSSAQVTVTDIPVLNAGLDGSLDLCQGDVQTYDLFDSLNGTPDLGGSWTPALAGGGSVFNPALDIFGTYTYSFNDGCNSNSATVTVTQTPSFDAGLDGILNICQGDVQTYDLFDSLNGTPDLGGSWTPALASGGSIFDPTLDAFGIYTYSFNDTCNNSSAQVIVTK